MAHRACERVRGVRKVPDVSDSTGEQALLHCQKRLQALSASTRPGLLVERILDLIKQPHHCALVACICRQFRCDNQLMLAIDRHLRVVALLEALGAGLHDGTVRVGEVALRLVFVFGFAVSVFVRLAALGEVGRGVPFTHWLGGGPVWWTVVQAGRRGRRG